MFIIKEHEKYQEIMYPSLDIRKRTIKQTIKSEEAEIKR